MLPYLNVWIYKIDSVFITQRTLIVITLVHEPWPEILLGNEISGVATFLTSHVWTNWVGSFFQSVMTSFLCVDSKMLKYISWKLLIHADVK